MAKVLHALSVDSPRRRADEDHELAVLHVEAAAHRRRLEEATAGDVLIDGERANDVLAAKRGTAMVFKSSARTARGRRHAPWRLRRISRRKTVHSEPRFGDS